MNITDKLARLDKTLIGSNAMSPQSPIEHNSNCVLSVLLLYFNIVLCNNTIIMKLTYSEVDSNRRHQCKDNYSDECLYF